MGLGAGITQPNVSAPPPPTSSSLSERIRKLNLKNKQALAAAKALELSGTSIHTKSNAAETSNVQHSIPSTPNCANNPPSRECNGGERDVARCDNSQQGTDVNKENLPVRDVETESVSTRERHTGVDSRHLRMGLIEQRGNKLDDWIAFLDEVNIECQNDPRILLPLFQRATSSIQAQGTMYDSDLYIQLWLDYATLQSTESAYEARSTLKLMNLQRIGISSANYYCVFAAMEQRAGHIEKAKQIIEKGILRGAKPVDLLSKTLEILTGQILTNSHTLPNLQTRAHPYNTNHVAQTSESHTDADVSMNGNVGECAQSQHRHSEANFGNTSALCGSSGGSGGSVLESSNSSFLSLLESDTPRPRCGGVGACGLNGINPPYRLDTSTIDDTLLSAQKISMSSINRGTSISTSTKPIQVTSGVDTSDRKVERTTLPLSHNPLLSPAVCTGVNSGKASLTGLDNDQIVSTDLNSKETKRVDAVLPCKDGGIGLMEAVRPTAHSTVTNIQPNANLHTNTNNMNIRDTEEIKANRSATKHNLEDGGYYVNNGILNRTDTGFVLRRGGTHNSSMFKSHGVDLGIQNRNVTDIQPPANTNGSVDVNVQETPLVMSSRSRTMNQMSMNSPPMTTPMSNPRSEYNASMHETPCQTPTVSSQARNRYKRVNMDSHNPVSPPYPPQAQAHPPQTKTQTPSKTSNRIQATTSIGTPTNVDLEMTKTKRTRVDKYMDSSVNGNVFKIPVQPTSYPHSHVHNSSPKSVGVNSRAIVKKAGVSVDDQPQQHDVHAHAQSQGQSRTQSQSRIFDGYEGLSAPASRTLSTSEAQPQQLRTKQHPHRQQQAVSNSYTPRNNNYGLNRTKHSDGHAQTQAPSSVTGGAKADFVVNGKAYTKLQVLGKGGSSVVYLVIGSDRKINALKMVKLEGVDAQTIRSYQSEIDLLKRLQGCDNIIRLHDSEVTSKYLFLVMEQGEIDLAKMLKRHKGAKFSDENYLRLYWQQMLEAVQSIHHQRIIHGDLKPANFLFVEGKLKLIDFGIAKAIQEDYTSVFRDAQGIVGTLNYISPEAMQAQEGGMKDGKKGEQFIKLGPASDIWSLGCILYAMVYGHTPFQQITNIYQKINMIVNPDHKIVFKPLANADLLDVLKRCLNRNPSKRLSIAELLDHPFLSPTGSANSTPHVRKMLEKYLIDNGKTPNTVANLSDEFFTRARGNKHADDATGTPLKAASKPTT
eukprot:CFRG2884T1